MPVAIAMPKLGLKMEEGTVLEWRAELGERIEKGQIVLLIESDKAETEIEAPADGVLRHIYIDPDETVPCGSFLAALTESADDDFDADVFRESEEVATEVGPAAAAPAVRAAPARAASAPRAGAPATPASRKRARELGVELERIGGTGPGGRITIEDVESFAAGMEARVEVAPGVALEVVREGQGSPLLLLPGFGSDVSAFARITPELVGAHETLGVNPRGVGASDAPELDAYAVETAAADVAALCEEPAHVVGASLGAAVALELALTRPEAVRTLTLVTPFVTASARLIAVLEGWAQVAADAPPDALGRALVPWLFADPTLADRRARERVVRGLSEMARHVPPATLARSLEGLRAWSGTRADALAGLSVPTLVIGADADLLTPDADAIASAIPNAKLVVVPAAGHAVALEAPELVAAAILEHTAAHSR